MQNNSYMGVKEGEIKLLGLRGTIGTTADVTEKNSMILSHSV